MAPIHIDFLIIAGILLLWINVAGLQQLYFWVQESTYYID